MLKAVFDTNVFVSHLINENGLPAQVVSLFFDMKVKLFYAISIYAEYEDVLNRERFHFNKNDVQKILKYLKAYGKLIYPITSSFSMKDEDDRIFYDTAKQSNSFLVTGNKKHYPIEPFILSPAEFLEISRSHPQNLQ